MKSSVGIGPYLSLLAMLVAVLSWVACSRHEGSFTTMPGFTEHFAQYPPSAESADARERQLLQRYRPRFYRAEGQSSFLDFYADYIAHGELRVDGTGISDEVDAELLQAYRDDTRAEFRHAPADRPVTPVVYGRVIREVLEHEGERWPLTFLNYNLAFAHSGLLEGLPFWQKWPVDVTGLSTDWHQLDHYVGLTVVLHEDQPIAVMLQQHNYQTTYLLGDPGEHEIQWPEDQRVAVDIARQSNELYPHSPEETQHRAVSFVTAENIRFLKTGDEKPLMAGYDITQGEQEQDYILKFLPSTDAFYQFKGRLGAQRNLPGRDGPPGADYVTLPGLMPWANRLVTGFRAGRVEVEQAKLKALFDIETFRIRPEGLAAYREDFISAALR